MWCSMHWGFVEATFFELFSIEEGHDWKLGVVFCFGYPFYSPLAERPRGASGATTRDLRCGVRCMGTFLIRESDVSAMERASPRTFR